MIAVAEASTIAQRQILIVTRLWMGMRHMMQKWQYVHRQQPCRLAANTQQQDGCIMTIQLCSERITTS